MTTSTNELRLLDLNEIEAVSGASLGNCSGKVTSIKMAKGTLDMGYDVCEGLPGVKLPWAVWTPSDKK